MTRIRLGLAAAAVTGFLLGAIAIAALADEPAPTAAERATEAAPSTTTTSWTANSTLPTSTAENSIPTTTSRPAPALDDVLLIWTSGGLTDGFAEAISTSPSIATSSTVRGAELRLVAGQDRDGAETERHADGWAVPVDALALDPVDHASFIAEADGAAFALLEEGAALLSRTGATLRGVGEGATLTFGSGAVTIVGVIDDASASGAELVVDLDTGRSLGILDEKFLLVRHRGDRTGVQEDAVDALERLGGGAPVRVRSPAETTWLRHGDAVLPLALVKARFGEFASRDTSEGDVEIDPAWVEEHIVDAEVPVLGTVRCHREMIPALMSALQELTDRALSHVIETGQFAGCFVPRRIAVGEPHSRHSWGIAIDINVGDNPRGSFSTQDPRLVDAMRTAGFGWGGSWLVPDPAHYEVIEPRADEV